MRGHVLLLGDDAMTATLRPLITSLGFEVSAAAMADDVLAALDEGAFDVLIAQDCDPSADIVALAAQVSASRPGIRTILLVAEPDFERALAALRAGVFDLFVMPPDPHALEGSLARALRQRALREEVERLRLAIAEARGFEELVGASQPMQRLFDLMERAAHTSASVLITGESGTGKELVARALHRASKRASGPFVAVNCSAIPDNLLESELFGHTKGAFTDARAARAGLFVRADGGTVFLDEIGDMPLALQPKLLRALQERKIRPVGGDVETEVDVRVIAATNVNLETAVADRSFREDLFYRINVIHIEVPPLRERASDILLVAQHFVEHYAALTDKRVVGLSAEAAEKLLAYSWPGNIRELQNCIERAVALTRHHELQVEDLPEKVQSYRRSHVLVVSNDPSELVTMEEVERRYIARVLTAVKGNKKEAARVLGLDRKTLYRRLERYGIEARRDRS